MQNRESLIEDEIDLKELFIIIWNKKIFILFFTLFATLLSLIYVFLKNSVPIYEGKTYIEIGTIQSQNFGESPLDKASDLAQIIKLTFKIDSNIAKGTTKILEIVFKNEDKGFIKQTLEKAIKTIIDKHKEKAKFYENVIMTKQIGEINVSNQPINQPKKSLIVAVTFITGFILSIFIVFFMQFISNIRKEEK